MSVQANWHLASLASADDADPMSELLNVAKPIDLSRDRARLNAELQSLIRAESRIYERTGTECELKFQAGWSCLTCPHRRTSPAQGEMYNVCQIGVHQFEILDQLARHTEVEELERAALAHMLAEECDELAEYALPVEAEYALA